MTEEVLGQLEGPALQAGVPDLQRAELRLAPALRIVGALARHLRRAVAQSLARVGLQRAHPHGLAHAVAPTGAVAHAVPAGSLVAGAVVGRIDVGLEQQRAHA
ncbi:MAG: hypothetical protein AN487_21380, partial [Anabaena sp. CRKS33]